MIIMKKRLPSKKYLIIFGIVFIVFLLFYGGSYWYLRDKTIGLEDQKELVLTPGYYFDIVYGIGLGNKDEPGHSVSIYPCLVSKKHEVEFKKWMVYFYYPLWRLEVAVWQVKTFGWKEFW
jgi:hypothetical protein